MLEVLIRLQTLCLLALAAGCAAGEEATGPRPHLDRPNLILVLADDLGYGDLGSYGQEVIQTPHLDRLAAEGNRFTDFCAGSTVCAPSRSVLMTGMHTGHTRILGNRDAEGGRGALQPHDLTVAELLKSQGYRTALIGKWGLGEEGTTGHPNAQGFDDFYGYLNQVHAHNYYPELLWRNRETIELRNVVERVDRGDGGFAGGWATEKVDYSHDLFVDEALSWIGRHRAEPFFLFLSLTIPHANNEAARALGDGQEVPDYGPYENEDWPLPDKGQAAMITRLDRDVGRLVAELESAMQAAHVPDPRWQVRGDPHPAPPPGPGRPSGAR